MNKYMSIGDIHLVETDNSDAKFYDVYLSNNASETQTNISDVTWNINTILHAQFENSLSAGNIDFILANCSSILTKVRPVGGYTWINIFQNNINGLASNPAQ